jgi:hypothetical protein
LPKGLSRGVGLSCLALLGGVFGWTRGAAAAENFPAFGVPILCDPSGPCLVQQFPDMQKGPGTSDPFCGGATYDAHDGTDIRLHSLRDIDGNVPVLAMAAGRILRSRDGEPDRLAGGREAIGTFAGKECGNGLVIDHGEGWETQYCHLKQSSLAKPAGTIVAKGEAIGFVGSSGWAQFPHVHVTVRHRGKALDPATGQAVGAGCVAEVAERHPLWDEAARQWFGVATHHIVDIGLSGDVTQHDSLVATGRPPSLAAGAEAVVGWGWLANLQKDDRVRITIIDPAEGVMTDSISDPLSGAKASYSQFAGRKRPPVPGSYRVTVTLLRQDAVLETRTQTLEVQP